MATPAGAGTPAAGPAVAAAPPVSTTELPLCKVKGEARELLLEQLKGKKVVQYLSGSRAVARHGSIEKAFSSLAGRKGMFDADIVFDGERDPRQVELKPKSENNMLFWVNPPSDPRLKALMPMWKPSVEEAMQQGWQFSEMAQAAAPAMPAPLTSAAAPAMPPQPPVAAAPASPPAQLAAFTQADTPPTVPTIESYVEKKRQLAAEKALLITRLESDICTMELTVAAADAAEAAAAAEAQEKRKELEEMRKKRRLL